MSPLNCLRCPKCSKLLDKATGEHSETFACVCGQSIQVIDGIEILVRDASALAVQLEQAKVGKHEAWYVDEQAEIQTGPYRHHIAKRRAFVEATIARIAASAGRKLSILDLGCGDGVNLAMLRRYADSLMGSDYNILRLQRAKRLALADTLILADILDYPVHDDSIDLVFFNHVIEHISDDVTALKTIERILRPGGTAIIGTPNEGAAFWQLAYRLQPKSRETTDHIHFYTGELLAARCREAGLVVREVKPIGWGIPHWGVDRRLRGVKAIDDGLEWLGSRLFVSQATSLYAVVEKTSGKGA